VLAAETVSRRSKDSTSAASPLLPSEIDDSPSAFAAPARDDCASNPDAAAPLFGYLNAPIARKAEESPSQDGYDFEASPGDSFARATSGGASDLPFRDEMEQSFGIDLSNVQAHLGQAAPMKDLCAKAATQGEQIAFASGAPDRELVAHEVAHVVQNRRGGSGGRAQVSSPGDASEVEAEALAAKASSGEAVSVGGERTSGIQREATEGAGSQAAQSELGQSLGLLAQCKSLAEGGPDGERKASAIDGAMAKLNSLQGRVTDADAAQLASFRAQLAAYPGRISAANAKQDQESGESAQSQSSEPAQSQGSEAAPSQSSEPAQSQANEPSQSQSNESSQGEAAVVQAPAPAEVSSDGEIQRDDECNDILQMIQDLVKELKQRYDELVEDEHNLQWDHWSKSDAHPNFGSVEGHQEQFENVQNRLRKFLKKFWDNNCGNGAGGAQLELPEDVLSWQGKAAPRPKYKPKPQTDADKAVEAAMGTVEAGVVIGEILGAIGWLLSSIFA
jgi:hypothetical protein